MVDEKWRDKRIYCMSFKWLQTPLIRKELLIFEPEAGIELMTRPFYITESQYEKQSWKILSDYDDYGFPSVELLDEIRKRGNKVYGCGGKFHYSCTEKVSSDGKTYPNYLDYWKHVHADTYRCPEENIEVRIEETAITAIPYDVPISDSDRTEWCTVRLWEAKRKYDINTEYLKEEYWKKAVEQELLIKMINEELFFPQKYTDGKRNCLRQKYFMVSATVQWAVKKHMEQYGNIHNFHEKNVLLLCDERCALAKPELIRILQRNYQVAWDEALKIADNACIYGMDEYAADPFEFWPEKVVSEMLPEIYRIEMAERGGQGQ